MGIVVLEILTGIILAYLSMPIFIQPVHLLLACILFGCQALLYFRLKSQL